MAFFLSPIGNDQYIDGNGNPRVGGLLFAYQSGTTTKVTTYKDNAGAAQHTNPIVLNSEGRPPASVWLTQSQTYKFVLAPAGDTDPPSSSLMTWDDVSGINDVSTTAVPQTVSEWIVGPTPTFVSATSFSLVGDVSATWHVGRRVRANITGSTLYGTITTIVVAANTTVGLTLDSGSLDATLSAVAYGIVAFASSSLPPLTRGPDYVANLGIAASVAGNALTISLKTASGADPSVNSPLDIAFRQSATVGLPIVRRIVSATSITVPAGATLGFVANYIGLVAVYVVDTGSGVAIGVCGIGPAISVDDSILQTTTQLTVSSDSEYVLYTANALAGVAVRLLGFVNLTGGATPGDWLNAPSYISATAYKHGHFTEQAGVSSANDGSISGTYAPDLRGSNTRILTATGNITSITPRAARAGYSYVFLITTGIASLSITWPANFLFVGGIDPVPSSANGAKDLLSCVYDGTNFWCSYSKGMA